MALGAVLVASDGAGATGTCPADTPRFSGRVHVTERSAEPFMMLSAYRLEPYPAAYVESALPALGRLGLAGVVYTSLGEITEDLARKGYPGDEVAYNRTLYRLAGQTATPLWLQMRVYANRLPMRPDGAVATATAEQILASVSVRRVFEAAVRREFEAYAASFRGRACRLIVFEEAGIYHAPQGGGRFWSSSASGLRRSEAADDLFTQRATGIFRIVRQTARSIDPACAVGMHLGHSAMDDANGLRDMMRSLGADRPDFIFYDLYPKAQRDPARFATLLTERAATIRSLGVPGYYLGQLHTMNSFQHGGGRTPSKRDIDGSIALAQRLGFAAIGLYGKNARATLRQPVAGDGEPLDPNSVAQSTVYSSSKDRWDYGVLRLAELGGLDLRRRFDLVVDAEADSRVMLKEGGGGWRLAGRTESDGVTVFRGIYASETLDGPNGFSIRFEGGTGRRLWALASEPPERFRTTASIASEIRSAGRPAAVVAAAHVSGGVARLCLR